jgi:signal transduction histidine kinase
MYDDAGDVPEEILVVDDDAESRGGTLELLELAGYRVRAAPDGAACLIEVAARPPSLILLDVSMPGLDGFETLRRLRAGPHRAVPVMLLTGNRLDPESIGSGLELGADEYVQKPVRAGELRARIRALCRLASTRRELEALKRDQTAMLVHDLKQPLAIIALRAEFVADEATDPELIRSGRAIREACRQMERLVNSVLELSRVEAGQLRLQRQAHHLPALVSDTIAQFQGLAERRGVELSFSVTSAEGHVDADGTKIVQVLQNLLGNALKFTPAGGRIEVRMLETDGEVQVTVEDTGHGLSREEAARVFDKWHQTKAGRAKGGSGLGLAIASAIVEAHGGRIGAGERLDGQRGARFWFVLPLKASLPRLQSAFGGAPAP